MKNRKLLMGIAVIMVMVLCVGCSLGKKTWTVTCPWAPSGVAAMVNEKCAALSEEMKLGILLEAEAIKGHTETVNTWIAETGSEDRKLVFGGEGFFPINKILDPDSMNFDFEDFVFVENLYSSIFVMSAQSQLGISSIPALEEYMKNVNKVTVATNGSHSSEAFLAAALFGAMGYGDKLEIIPYESAKEAAEAVGNGETDFAISHQSQILETYQQIGVTIVCAFDDEDIKNGAFVGVEGIGKYGYPYFRNRCFILAPKGAEEEGIEKLRELYRSILSEEEMESWLQNDLLLDVDFMTKEDALEHIQQVEEIVNEYYDIVVK